MAVTTDGPTAWLIVEHGVAVGMTSFTKCGDDGLYEIGYGIAPAYEGRGVMTRALRRIAADPARQWTSRLDRRD